MNLFEMFELSQQYRQVREMCGDPEIDPQAVLDTLDGIAGEFQEKADNIACLVKELEAQAKAMRAESDALAQRAKARSAKADRLKEFLYRQMALAGVRKIETPRNLLQIKKTPASVRFEDEQGFLRWAAAHPEYLRQIPPQPDKTAIKEAVKAGTAIPGVSLESGETFSVK